MTPLQKHLLEKLQELSYGELERFKHVLRYSKMKEVLPRIPGKLMEMTDRVEIVELIEGIYGEQAVEVTNKVLMKMNRSDLVQSLSNLSIGSEGNVKNLLCMAWIVLGELYVCVFSFSTDSKNNLVFMTDTDLK